MPVPDAPANDSIQAFRHGDPVSMSNVPASLNRHKSVTAWAMSSGLLSKRRLTGAARSVLIFSRQATTAFASMERSTSMARNSRVNSSMTLSSLMVRPSGVRSNWKSRAHTTLGWIRHMAPIRSPVPLNASVASCGARSPRTESAADVTWTR